MHITILTLGSRGDVVPYAALGTGLMRAGHTVRLITFEDFEPLARQRGFEFWPIRGEMRALLTSQAGLELTESGASVARMAWSLMRMFGGLARGFADDLSDPHLRQTDLFINQLPGALYGYDLAEIAGIPMMLAAVMPLTPTRSEPMLAFPQWPGPVPGYNRLTHWMAYQIAWGMFRSTIRRWRVESLGLGPVPFMGVWRALQDERFVVLNAFSPSLVSRPQDWAPQVHITGAWFEDDMDWRPPESLARFIEAGAPPVYVGFGSMPTRNAHKTRATVMDALRRTGRRAVVQLGLSGGGTLPDFVFEVEDVPHDWLFPRMAAVVHHGGSGTTHAGVRAGVPSVLVPFVFDQFFWGRRVQALGIGPKPVPFGKLSVGRLASALERAVHDSDLRRRAAGIGERVRAEDGVRTAIDLIQRLRV